MGLTNTHCLLSFPGAWHTTVPALCRLSVRLLSCQGEEKGVQLSLLWWAFLLRRILNLNHMHNDWRENEYSLLKRVRLSLWQWALNRSSLGLEKSLTQIWDPKIFNKCFKPTMGYIRIGIKTWKGVFIPPCINSSGWQWCNAVTAHFGLLSTAEDRLNVHYLSNVADHLHPFMIRVYPSVDRCFQQNNPCHKAQITSCFLNVTVSSLYSNNLNNQQISVQHLRDLVKWGDSHHWCAASLRRCRVNMVQKSEKCFQQVVKSLQWRTEAALKAKGGVGEGDQTSSRKMLLMKWPLKISEWL